MKVAASGAFLVLPAVASVLAEERSQSLDVRAEQRVTVEGDRAALRDAQPPERSWRQSPAVNAAEAPKG